MGFLPLLKKEVDGFSMDENASDSHLWTESWEQEPCEWLPITHSRKALYGKIFGEKADVVDWSRDS